MMHASHNTLCEATHDLKLPNRTQFLKTISRVVIVHEGDNSITTVSKMYDDSFYANANFQTKVHSEVLMIRPDLILGRKKIYKIQL